MTPEQYEAESYIDHFSRHNSAVVDEAILDDRGRLAKAEKIRTVLRDFSSAPLSSLDCLDLGCSTGTITRELASDFQSIVGIDTDQKALGLARRGQTVALFQRGSALSLPYRAEAFDVVLCNHIYEHVSNQQQLFDEIRRVLRPGGLCYFGAGNRLKLIEPHYRLPFLSWLPRGLSHLYLRLSGRGRYYFENHLTVGGLRRLVSNFEIHDYTMKIIGDPRRFGGSDPLLDKLPSGGVPAPLLRLAYFLLPTYIWVLRKPPPSSSQGSATVDPALPAPRQGAA